MDRRTVDAYERGVDHYVRNRRANAVEAAGRFAAGVGAGRLRADLGSGPGHYTPLLGRPVVALDASRGMVATAVARTPGTLAIQADLEALPLRRAALAGAWASKSYQHVAAPQLPLSLADLHRSLAVGAWFELTMFLGEGTVVTGDDDDFPGRVFALWEEDALLDVVNGAGFEVAGVALGERGRGGMAPMRISALRARTLADTVGPGMRLLVCGLNPSLYAADAGIGFARPGNRFWPAAIAAGLVSRDRDPWHALVHHGVGMTDLVKRATVGAAELSSDEYRAGARRVGRLCEWLRPGALCVVGLTGWRAAVDPRAVAGLQPAPFAGLPVYVLPNPSGRNSHTSPSDLVAHLRAAAAVAGS